MMHKYLDTVESRMIYKRPRESAKSGEFVEQVASGRTEPVGTCCPNIFEIYALSFCYEKLHLQSQ